MFNDIDKAIIESNNLKVTCLKILDKLPQTNKVKSLRNDLQEENKTYEQLELCIKVITLMTECLEIGGITFEEIP